MSANGHALMRTSPKGGPFFGTCTKCGLTNLPMRDAGHPCVNPGNLSPDDALIIALGGGRQ